MRGAEGDVAISWDCFTTSWFAMTELSLNQYRAEVFKPAKLKLKLFLSSIGRGNLITLVLPVSAYLEIFGPPGYSKPRILAALSKHSPAASSNVAPIFLYFPLDLIKINSVCPPEAMRARAGYLIDCSVFNSTL